MPSQIGRNGFWGAHAFGVLAKAFRLRELFLNGLQSLRVYQSKKSSFRRNAETSTLQACAPQRYVANNFVSEVEESRGSTANAACDTETKLVEAKLEMVRAAGLFQCSGAVSHIRWVNTRDRLQRDEIDRCL